MYYFQINYKETGYRTYPLATVANPERSPLGVSHQLFETRTRFTHERSVMLKFEKLPTFTEMKEKVLEKQKDSLPNPNESITEIIVCSFSQLSKEHYEVLSGVKPKNPYNPESKEKPVVEYPCKQNRNPKECSINLYTKGGCDICFYKKELEPNK